MKYRINGNIFETLKEAIKEQNKIENYNKQFIFNPKKRKDSKIIGIDDNYLFENPEQTIKRIKNEIN